MSNVCIYGEEIDLSTKGQQPTFKDILVELNRLKLENDFLKADKIELQKENMQLRNDKNELHNRLNENTNICLDKTLFEGNNPDNGYDEEELANAYAMADKDKKFV